MREPMGTSSAMIHDTRELNEFIDSWQGQYVTSNNSRRSTLPSMLLRTARQLLINCWHTAICCGWTSLRYLRECRGLGSVEMFIESIMSLAQYRFSDLSYAQLCVSSHGWLLVLAFLSAFRRDYLASLQTTIV